MRDSPVPDPEPPHDGATPLPRRHLIFLDGTWNSDEREGEETHIVRLRNLAAPKPDKRDNEPFARAQTIYYDSGVATDLKPLDRFTGGAFGVGLGDKVRQAYRHLSSVYWPGDEICVFGFSRGAYTARSLVGYIAAAGLLMRPFCTAEAEAEAWAYYRTPPKKRSPGAGAERAMRVHAGLRVRAMGIFDTVGALGIPSSGLRLLNRLFLQFHDTEVSSIVDYAFHAVAIDERRKPFQAALWQNPFHQDFVRVEQVWFPGVHSDVGGGYDDHRLGDIPLRWLIDRLERGPGTEAGAHVRFTTYARDGGETGQTNEPHRMETKAARRLDDMPRPLGPVTSDESVQEPGLPDIPVAPQNESRSWRYHVLYPKPLLRLINQTWPAGDQARLRATYSINAFKPFQAPIGEMLHWSALVRLGREVEIRGAPFFTPSRQIYAPDNLVAVLPNILMTYTGERHRLFGPQQAALDALRRLAIALSERSDKDVTIRQLRVVRHEPDSDPQQVWRARELDPENDVDCLAVLRQLLRLHLAGLLKTG